MIIWTTFRRASLRTFRMVPKKIQRSVSFSLFRRGIVRHINCPHDLHHSSVQLSCSWLAWNTSSFWKRSRIDVYSPSRLIFLRNSLASKWCFRHSWAPCLAPRVLWNVMWALRWVANIFVSCKQAFLLTHLAFLRIDILGIQLARMNNNAGHCTLSVLRWTSCNSLLLASWIFFAAFFTHNVVPGWAFF